MLSLLAWFLYAIFIFGILYFGHRHGRDKSKEDKYIGIGVGFGLLVFWPAYVFFSSR